MMGWNESPRQAMDQIACPLEVLAAQCKGQRNRAVVQPSLPAPLVRHATLPAHRYRRNFAGQKHATYHLLQLRSMENPLQRDNRNSSPKSKRAKASRWE